MAVRVRCPNGHPLTVKDNLRGKRVRCPRCKELFRADEVDEDGKPLKPAKPPLVKPKFASDDDSDVDERESEATPEDRRRNRQRDKRSRLRKVSIGLLLHLCKTWAMTVVIFFELLHGIFSAIIPAAEGPGVNRLAPAALEIYRTLDFASWMFVIVLSFASSLTGIVGSGFCLLIPKKSNARNLAAMSIAFDVLALVATILLLLAGNLTTDDVKKVRLEDLLRKGSLISSIAAFFSFIVYLRLLALYLKKPDFGTKAMAVLTYLIVFALTLPIILFGMDFLIGFVYGIMGPPMTVAVGFLITIVWFAGFYYLWFQPILGILSGLRATIEEVT